MHSPESRLLTRATLRWILLVLLSGLSLLGVLPFGMISVLHPMIPFFSITHIGTLTLATVCALIYLYHLSTACRWPPILTWCALIVPVTGLFVLGRLPTIDPAALGNYLAIPTWWIGSGAITPLLWYEPSLAPQLIGLAFMELINNDLTRLIPAYLALYLVCLAGLIARFVESRTHRRESACLAFLLTLTVPIAIRSATVAWPNLPAALFIGVVLLLLVGWLEEGGRRSLPILAGIGCALAASCSREAILSPVAILPALWCAARARGISRWGTVKSCALVVFTMFVFFSPWLIKNGVWIANPFYPLCGTLLGTNSLIAGGGSPFDLVNGVRGVGERWREVLLSPFTIAFFSRDGASGAFDGVTSPLFALAVIPLWLYRKHPWVILLGVFSLLFFLLAAVGELTELRSFLPLLTPVVTLTLLGIGAIGRRFKRRFERATVGFLVAAHILTAGVYVVDRGYLLGAWTRHLDTATYLREHLADYRFIEVVNREVAPTEYIYTLLTGTSLAYYVPRIITGGVEQVAQVKEWLRLSTSTRIIAQEFLNRGIRFIALDPPSLDRVLAPTLGSRERELWERFQATHLTEIASVDTRRLYTVAAAEKGER